LMPGSLCGGGRGLWCALSLSARRPALAHLAGRLGLGCGMPGEGTELAGGCRMWRPAMRLRRRGG
jgi:hypothetical protein